VKALPKNGLSGVRAPAWGQGSRELSELFSKSLWLRCATQGEEPKGCALVTQSLSCPLGPPPLPPRS
jgi:hypothetical protein